MTRNLQNFLPYFRDIVHDLVRNGYFLSIQANQDIILKNSALYFFVYLALYLFDPLIYIAASQPLRAMNQIILNLYLTDRLIYLYTYVFVFH